jgi:hypothetical protein
VAVDAIGDALAVWVGVYGHGGVVRATDLRAANPVWTAPKRVSGALCTVPRLVGLMLPRAEAALRGNACRTGRITWAYSRTARRGRVLTQRRRPGMTLPDGAEVDMVVSRGS